MTDGDTETTLIGPDIGTKEVKINEAFKLGPELEEYTQMVLLEDSNKEGACTVTEKVFVAESSLEVSTGNKVFPLPIATLI